MYVLSENKKKSNEIFNFFMKKSLYIACASFRNVNFSGVLFCVGGRGASGDPYKTIECYHPMKNRWFQVTEMNTRRRHVGVCTFNGKIFTLYLYLA